MKPRTKQEREVVRLSQGLPPITDRQRQWAVASLEHKAHSTGKTQWCTACGHVMEHGLTTCPACGAKLRVELTNKRTDKTIYYAVVHTTRKHYQVARYFHVRFKATKGQKPQAEINEAAQEWLNVNTGTSTIMGRDVSMNIWWCDIWNFGTPLTIKKRSNNCYERSWNRYHIWSEVERWESLHPILKRNGAQRHEQGVQPMELYHLLLKEPFVEMLVKTGQQELLEHYCRGNGNVCAYEHAVRICNRNHYIVEDASMWCDYLDMLTALGLDTHNAHYVCPQDLEQAHDRIQERYERQQARERQERIEQDKQWQKNAEKMYKKLHAKYLAIFFGNDAINISVAQSVKDIREEGKHMHHCVYANGYYKKANSLILFARDKHTGKRIETIEINLKTFSVVQSRGVCNSMTPQHKEIIDLCNKNMHLLRAVA